MGSRLADKTTKTYNSNNSRFYDYVKNHSDDNINCLYTYDEETGADVDLANLPPEVITEFLGHISNDTDSARLCESTIGGYRSALVELYGTKKLSHLYPTQDVKDFTRGYNRVLGNAKKVGERSVQEGKRAFAYKTYVQ